MPRVGEVQETSSSGRAAHFGEVAAEVVAPLSGWGAVLFACFTVGHFFVLPPEERRLLVPLAGATSVAMALLAVYVARHRPSPRAAHPLLFLLLMGGVINSAAHLAIQGKPLQSTNFVLLFVGAGIILLSRRLYALLFVLGCGAWLAVALSVGTAPEWVHMGFAMLSAGLVGMASVVVRKEMATRLFLSRASLQENQEALTRALGEARGELEQRQKVERELRELGQELEARVEKRTRELADSHGRLSREVEERESVERDLSRQSEELRQAQRLETVGLLAGGVAHDFNNMLTVVTACAELGLRRIPEDSAARGLLVEIQSTVTQASVLIRQLLAIGRKQVLEPRPTDLNEIVTRLRPLLERVLGAHVELSLDLAPTIETTEIDVGQLEQVFVNLAVNARDAMPSGGRLTITTGSMQLADAEQSALPAGRYVLCAVSDTGYGMSEAVRARVFEPFFTTKEARGTGLGLASVYGIVKQSRGDIVADSVEGEGTTFRMWLPVAGRSHPAAAKSLAPPDALATVGRGERILLVEDNEAVRDLMLQSLVDAGFAVTTAEEGRAALERASSAAAPFDMVITDVLMPGMGGRELVERLSARQPNLPVLFMSAYAADYLGDLGAREHMALLQKPFAGSVLVQKVAEMLRAAASG